MFFALCLWGTQSNAQNVTIEPSTGNLVAALTYEGETGFAVGLSSLWRHEQLALSMTTSDGDELTNSGEISDPSAALGIKNDNLIFVSGHMPLFFVVSLPNGYRFTGYEIVLKNDLVGEDVRQPGSSLGNNSDFAALPAGNNKTMRFYEVQQWENGSSHVRDNQNYNNLNPIGSTIITQAQADDESTDIIFNDANKGKEFKMSRVSDKDENSPLYMGNQLYFRFTKNAYFCGLSIKSFTLYFTSEGTFTAPVKPSTVSATPVSMLPLPFYTNKIDFGEMDSYTKDGATYFSYHHENVQDLLAFNYIYQEDALENGEPADVASTKKIYQTLNGDNNYLGLKNGVYYVETPVTITNSSGNHAPIGYRIVGAKLNYAYGTENSGGTQTEEYYLISYTSGGRTYYLNTSGRFGTSPIRWEVDNSNYVHSGDVYLTYSTSGYGYNTTYNLTTGSSSSNQKVSYNNGYLSITAGGNTRYLQGTTSATTQPTFSTSSSTNNRALCQYQSIPHTYPAFTPEEYFIDVYDKTGKTYQTITVSGGSDTYDFGPLNNDAIKFAIRGVDGTNGMALVTVDLFLQALDPYIDKMDIVCHDKDNVLELTQTFTADNFRVSGGRFVFYVPADYGNEDLTFTFRDLYSQYGDNTYYDGTGEGNSRYSFVTSDYFFNYDGYTDGNEGLYDKDYDPDYPYTTKVYTSTGGNVRFKFNNAEDLGNTGASTEEHYLEEYPFSTTAYLNSVDPDAEEGTTPTEAAFVDIVLNASKEAQKSGTYYLFTADETRWNIAPSKAWQHRFYAYYRMELEVIARQFDPELTWTPIYDETFGYSADTSTGNVSTAPMYGLSLRTKDETGAYFDKGYLTYKEIIDAIDNADNKPAALNNTNQILYVDASKIYQVLNSKHGDVETKISDLKSELATNALVFLPANTKSLEDNVAYETSSGSFHAGKNIVLTDKQPFFSKYDIQVDAANYAMYTRQITCDDYGKVNNATLILPFALSVGEEGVHTNTTADACSFSLNTMEDKQEIEQQTQSPSYVIPNVSFLPISGTSSEANKPYVVQVKTAATGDDNSNYSFVATQYGANIVKTPTQSAPSTLGQKFFTGETATGKYTYKSIQPNVGEVTVDYSCTAEGNYSGVKYDREVSENVFYFAANQFINLHTLNANEQYLLVYPFRSVYTYSGELPINFFNAIFNDEIGETDAIAEMPKRVDLAVRSGKGYLSMISAIDQTVNVRTLNGMSVGELNMRAGDNRSINLPAGIYLVNNVKIIVK